MFSFSRKTRVTLFYMVGTLWNYVFFFSYRVTDMHSTSVWYNETFGKHYNCPIRLMYPKNKENCILKIRLLWTYLPSFKFTIWHDTYEEMSTLNTQYTLNTPVDNSFRWRWALHWYCQVVAEGLPNAAVPPPTLTPMRSPPNSHWLEIYQKL